MAEMREPSRRCIACRQSIGKAQLVRFSYVDGGIQYDSDGRLGGRGAYLHPHLLCVQKAARRSPMLGERVSASEAVAR